MAFDACFIAAIEHELTENIIGARIEKVQQPEKDELILVLHRDRQNIKLSVSASANNPLINITSIVKENPKAAPMFCMLLRKHLTGAKITSVSQMGFERVLEIEFEAYDELGFLSKKYIMAEIMGKYSNIIFCDKSKKIISAIKIVDFSTSQKRQVLPGMQYELPPSQEKQNPLNITEIEFKELLNRNYDIPRDKFITNNFMGIAALTAREIVFQSEKTADCSLWVGFNLIFSKIRNKEFLPILIYNIENKPLDFSFMQILQYGNTVKTQIFEGFGQLIDEYYGSRERSERIKQRSNDVAKLILNIEARLVKKIALQESDLHACAEKDTYKLYGDIITSNIYQLKTGMKHKKLINYYSENMDEVELTLDEYKTPVQNAQLYYKRYNKAKATERELTMQLELAKNELSYIRTVEEAHEKAENEADINEIRRELYESGYASRMKDYINYTVSQKKPIAVKPLEFKTDGGFKLLCGKNNNQNDFITFKCATKNDYWFHVKNAPGSHVVMMCDVQNENDPSDLDFTQAAAVAAYFSKFRDGINVPVDYTLIRNVKKPSGSKPGFVIYTTNRTAYVSPDKETVDRLKIK
ncbi:MAG: Rqc2 family fibronectin-binding protein [Eubacteriales bacterium]